MLPYIASDAMADRDRGKRFGFWEPIEGPQSRRRIFFEFFRSNDDEKILANLLNYFKAIQERWPAAWESNGKGNMINRTNGYNAFIRFLKFAYLNFTTSPAIVSQDAFKSLFDLVRLEDKDFNTRKFLPGTSGSKALFDQSKADTRL